MMKVILSVLQKLLSVIKLICYPARRIFCRRRRNSETLLPTTIKYNDVGRQQLSNQDHNLESWDSWGGEQNDNSSRKRTVSEQDALPEPDYFNDMQPDIKKAAKILVRKKEENMNNYAISNKLAMSSQDTGTFQNVELQSWEESQNSNAWEDASTDDLSYEADLVVKEKRRLERQQRQMEQMRKKQDRDTSRTKHDAFSAVKLS